MADATRNLQIIISAKDEASRTLGKFSTQLTDLAKDAALPAAALLTGFGLIAKGAIKMGSEFQSAKVSFTTFLGSAERAGQLLSELSDFAVKTPFDMPQVVEGAKSLLAYGVAADDVVDTFRMLGDLSSGSSVKLGQLTLAFGQVKAATYLTGAELRQFTEAGVPLLETLAKQSGKTAAQVKEGMEKGMKIPFEDVKKAMKSLTSEGGRFYNNMEAQSKTFGGVMSNTKDEVIRFTLAVLGFTKEGDIKEGSVFYYLQLGAERLLVVLQKVRPQAEQFMQSLLKNKPALFAIAGVFIGLATAVTIASLSFLAAILPFVLLGAAIGFFVGAVVHRWPMLVEVFNTAKAAIESALLTIQLNINIFVAFIQSIPTIITNTFNMIKDGIIGALTAIAQFITDIYNSISNFLINYPQMWLDAQYKFWVTDLPYVVGYAIGWLQTNVPKIIEFVTEWFSLLPGRILEFLQKVLQNIMWFIAGAFVAFTEFVTKSKASMTQFVNDSIALFIMWKNALWNKVIETSTSIMAEIRTWPEKIKNLISSIPSIVTGIFSEAKNAAGGQMSELYNIVAGWWSKIKSIFDSIIKAAQNAINKAKEAYSSGKKSGSKQHGGFVNAGINEAVPQILHGGERVIPRTGVDVNSGRLGGGPVNLTINFSGGVQMDSPDRVRELADKIINMLGRQNELAARGVSV